MKKLFFLLLFAITSFYSNNLLAQETALDISGTPAYNTVKIGRQEWMTENLDVNKFRNGDSIAEVTSDIEWITNGVISKPSCAYYNNENDHKSGRLYNWFVATDQRGVCPEGFHVPNNNEWLELIRFLGGEKYADNKLGASSGWTKGEFDNSSGFSAVPAGVRNDSDGKFISKGYSTAWWSSTKTDDDFYGSAFPLNGYYNSIFRADKQRRSGFAIRCLKD